MHSILVIHIFNIMVLQESTEDKNNDNFLSF